MASKYLQYNKGKISLFLILSLVGVFSFWQREMIGYLWMQGKGQLSIVSNTIPLDDVLKSDTISAKNRFLLELIPEIKSFSEKELGLTPGDNYTSYYQQKGKPILWALTACPPYSLEPYKWSFPILGELEYKGFFEKPLGDLEAQKLQNQGFDIELGEVSAWSTLGILSDPILSSMLELDTGKFVRLLVHELTHATVYISSDAVFNENMATYIGDKGALQFLNQKFGENSPVVQRYKETLQDIELFSEYTVAYSKSIDLLYKSLPSDSSMWPILKQRSFKAYKNKLFLLPFNDRKRYQNVQKLALNNTFFTGFLMYHNQQDSIQKLIKELHAGSIKNWVESIKG
ncbi:aminopeptidase [Salibacteraceae bacterium]|nr:hypothetical protein [Crocinitomicaceae bacterium]MCH9822498.1 aminopeptidase [Bacteroidota bacterium]MDA9938200.1 aminopeptidase [Salibacteraceae bacterium]MDB0058206.1 aminopeptidase [Salibacteraceae bacterium]MDB9725239.1 aminopeptidase [Salibacteraceae bacterium]|tara:strand:- start:308899 stop:309930 length:1032 start_codon:yes stop_codon:yes gene_type:complete